MRKRVVPYRSALWHKLGFSQQGYARPLKAVQYKVLQTSPEHRGRFSHAVDLLLVDHNPSLPVFVYAPASGMVVVSVLHNTTWGPSSKFVQYLNFINVRVGNNEFYELAHILPVTSKKLKYGVHVEEGELIAQIGLNGRITVSKGMPEVHLHMLVGRWLPRYQFRNLRIRWKNKGRWY